MAAAPDERSWRVHPAEFVHSGAEREEDSVESAGPKHSLTLMLVAMYVVPTVQFIVVWRITLHFGAVLSSELTTKLRLAQEPT